MHSLRNNIWFTTAVIVVFWTFSLPVYAGEVFPVGIFSAQAPGPGLPDQWMELTFPKIKRHSRYELVKDKEGTTVLKAHSRGSASGLIRRIDVDVSDFCCLSWSWRAENILSKGDVTRKQGDDYPARIYVAFAFEADKASWWERLSHKTASLAAGRELPGMVLNYIWASHAPVGLFVDNPFTAKAKMIVLRSGKANLGRWMKEHRNVKEDYQKAFGHPPPQVIGIAVMTDTDNTGEEAQAYYGDIVMTKE